jgi:hypothetical protein
MVKNNEKYAVELDDYDCGLILDNAIVFGQLKATLTRMSKKEGLHTIQMSLDEISDLAGYRLKAGQFELVDESLSHVNLVVDNWAKR